MNPGLQAKCPNLGFKLLYRVPGRFGGRGRAKEEARQSAQGCEIRSEDLSIFFRKHVREPDFELPEHRIQLVQSEVVLAFFNAEQGHVGNAGLLGKLGIRQRTPGFTQKQGQLTIQAFSHRRKVAKKP